MSVPDANDNNLQLQDISAMVRVNEVMRIEFEEQLNMVPPCEN